jgi:hypothetical protein
LFLKKFLRERQRKKNTNMATTTCCIEMAFPLASDYVQSCQQCNIAAICVPPTNLCIKCEKASIATRDATLEEWKRRINNHALLTFFLGCSHTRHFTYERVHDIFHDYNFDFECCLDCFLRWEFGGSPPVMENWLPLEKQSKTRHYNFKPVFTTSE